MIRHFLSHKLIQLLRRLLTLLHILRENNIRPRYLGSKCINKYPGDGAVVDFRVGEEEAFELGGGNLEAFVFNEFFDAVGYVEVSAGELVVRVRNTGEG